MLCLRCKKPRTKLAFKCVCGLLILLDMDINSNNFYNIYYRYYLDSFMIDVSSDKTHVFKIGRYARMYILLTLPTQKFNLTEDEIAKLLILK